MNNTQPQVFIDMDGVIVDFVGSIIKKEKLTRVQVELENYKMESWKGIPSDLFSKTIPKYTPGDWARFTPMPLYHIIMNTCVKLFGLQNTFILSSPGGFSSAPSGKFRWVSKHVGREFARDNLILTSQKHQLALPHRVLIDDNEKMCKEWSDAGGKVLKYPALWNSRYIEFGEDLSDWGADYLLDTDKFFTELNNLLKR